jgi:hypothetical protein
LLAAPMFALVVLMMAIALVRIAISVPQLLPLALVALVAQVAGMWARGALFYRNSALSFRDGQIGKTGVLGRIKVFPVAELERVVRVRVSQGWGQPLGYYVFVRRDGKPGFRVSDRFWPESELVPLWSAIGRWPESGGGVMSSEEVRARYPGVLGWRQAHLGLFWFVFWLGAGLVMVALVFSAHPGR